MFESMLTNAEYKTCPWESADIAEDAYLKMGKVVIITFTYTFLHALLYMLCKGWCTTNQNMDRNRATNLTLIIGVMYLMYSAYFLQSDLIGVTSFINFAMTFAYSFLAIVNLKGIQEQVELMKRLLNRTEEIQEAPFQESLRLKMKMLKFLQLFIVLFFLPKILMYYTESQQPHNEFLRVRLNSTIIFLEVISFGFLLWIFRPRKQWPDFFTLGIGGIVLDEQRLGRPDMNINQVITNFVPILNVTIDNNFLMKGFPTWK